ncbi:MAG: DNA gyrase subunit A, partial [Gammaproteobacteria bacterium]|nr:DNA gyrase subunit A [Gammaproteobacteria bacterium]
MADTPRTLSVSVEHELTKSYLDYAMSVIVGRALPDCRDGLKPVHRRILYAMHELGNTASKPYKKSARIVGDVHGKYHPHGESAIYDSIVRLAQSFSMRYTLIDGQGNFGSVDGDMAAAARYTEIRMTPLTQQLLLTDLDKETVNFTPNYDGSEMIPDVLPAAFPNFLVNGSAGIAVGMATQTPPHNLGEVLDAFIYYIDHPDCTTADLMQYLPGPDFPTRGQILGTQGIYQAYQTGKGRVVLRGTHHLEHPTEDRTTIVITEIPYQVNKAKLVEKIAELAREKTIEGIAALRDESDKEGMRIALELKRDGNAELILNQLYQLTQLQSSFSINMVGLANGRPQLLTLLKIFEYFLQHRLDVITRRVRYEFQKARNKVHLLEGLAVALSHIDEIIALIQNSNTAKDAKEALCERRWHAPSLEEWLDNSLREALLLPQNLPYGLSDSHYQLSQKQADTILEMRLHKLTALEKDELKNDY